MLMLEKSIEYKLKKALNLIKLFDKNKWRETIVSFSGGKDSSLLLHLIFMVFKKIPFQVIFFNNGLHFNETIKFIKLIEKKYFFKIVTINHNISSERKYIFELKNKIENLRVKKINQFILQNKIKYLITGHKKTDSISILSLKQITIKYISKRKIKIFFPLFDFNDYEVLFLNKNLGVPLNQSYNKFRNSEGRLFLKKNNNFYV